MKEAVDIGSRRELFVDDWLIDEFKGARLELQRTERREIAFEADAAWEDTVGSALSLVQDGDSLRLYYRAGILRGETEDDQIIALAESTDGGLSFERPNLGLVEFEGSKKNNILMIGGPPRIPPAFIDANPDCPPDQRYKGLSAKWRSLYAMCSADGLRWRPMHPEPLQMSGTFDTINTAFWDSLAGCYRSFTRYFENLDAATGEADVLGPKPTVVRAIQGSTSTDFVNWTPPVPHEYGDEHSRTQLYTNSTQPCPGAEHIYVAFPNRYVQERIVDPEHKHPGVNDALFMVSRDTVHWHRYLEAWVRPGLDERNWTERNNYPAWGIVETSPTEWSLFISEHYRQADGAPNRLRRLAVRPHGFAAVHADYQGGEFTTRPIIFGGHHLCLNYSTSAAGRVQVELQDAGGQPLDGFALADAPTLFGDRLDETVSWEGGGDLSALVGQPVRFRFVLQDADVFAMRTIS